MTFVAIALHDREHLVGPCFAALELAGRPFRLGIVSDGADFDVAPYLRAPGDVVVELAESCGVATARNELLKHREPGENFMALDSDVVMETGGWLHRLQTVLFDNLSVGAVSPIIGPPWMGNMTPGTGLHAVGNISGVKLVRGDVMDRLGFYNSYGAYGYEDLDLDARIQALGFELAYDTQVIALHPETQMDGSRREATDEARPKFKNWEALYQQGKFLYCPPEGHYVPENNPRWAMGDERWGTHLPYLQRAVRDTKGPVIEVGTGFYSTPYLMALARQGRKVVGVERDRRWLALAKERAPKNYEVREDIPEGEFSVALIDGNEDERVAALETLGDRTELLVCHDTEEDLEYYGAALDQFKHRRDFDEKPRTTVVSNVRRFAA